MPYYELDDIILNGSRIYMVNERYQQNSQKWQIWQASFQ